MIVLALESSSKAASCALCRFPGTREAPALIAQSYQNSGLTHSRTLLPMVEDLLKNCGVPLTQVDLIAVANGPGSFTGIRIGVSAAKGLAWARDIPCAGCSTLESMAWSLVHLEGAELTAAMDARRDQVYAARFRVREGVPLRLTEDKALSVDELASDIVTTSPGVPQVLLGDGYYLLESRQDFPHTTAPAHLRYPSAWGVALCGWRMAQEGQTVTAAQLTPNYHRLSQAERERLEKGLSIS